MSGSLAQGPRVRELEEQFAAFVGVPHAVATSSGTTALHLALLAAGVGPGSEVITVPFTFIASATSVLYTGARPVFVDVNASDFCMDPSLLEAAITPRTKAVMPVSLYGQPADMPAISEIADRHGIAVIEDAAQSHGAAIDGRHSGTWGQGVFSFYPTKNMTTGEGGMITTADTDLADWARLRREHGMTVRYHHDVLGYNFRMTDIHAAIGLAQLKKLPAFNARRTAIAARYDRCAAGRRRTTDPTGGHPRLPPVHPPRAQARCVRRAASRAGRGHGRLLPDPGPPSEAAARSRLRRPAPSRSASS